MRPKKLKRWRSAYVLCHECPYNRRSPCVDAHMHVHVEDSSGGFSSTSSDAFPGQSPLAGRMQCDVASSVLALITDQDSLLAESMSHPITRQRSISLPRTSTQKNRVYVVQTRRASLPDQLTGSSPHQLGKQNPSSVCSSSVRPPGSSMARLGNAVVVTINLVLTRAGTR